MASVEEGFRGFAAMCLSCKDPEGLKNAHDIFFAGAYYIFLQLVRLGKDHSQISTDEVEMYYHELHAFISTKLGERVQH